jgi:hypothetical protein
MIRNDERVGERCESMGHAADLRAGQALDQLRDRRMRDQVVLARLGGSRVVSRAAPLVTSRDS